MVRHGLAAFFAVPIFTARPRSKDSSLIRGRRDLLPWKKAVMDAGIDLGIALDWKYRAEGNANVVFGYEGSLPHLQQKVLRVRKKPMSDTPPGDMASEQLFATTVIGPLVGDQFIPQAVSQQRGAWSETSQRKGEMVFMA